MPPNDDEPASRAEAPDRAAPLRFGAGQAGGGAPAGTDPQVSLDHIREIGQTARGSWFALLALLAFVGVTMMAHSDAAFFAAGVATELPVVGIEVPTISFFIAAPLLMAALYVHLHLYLIHLWDALADVPARIGEGCLLDHAHPTMIAQAAILYRSRARKDHSAPPQAHARAMQAVTLALVWLSTPALLAWLWWRSIPLHDPWLTLWVAGYLAVVCYFGAGGARIARARLSRPREEREKIHAPGLLYRLFAKSSFLALVAVLSVLSWETTRGGLLLDDKADLPAVLVSALSRATGGAIPHGKAGLPPLLVPADLREAELTPRPPDWKPFELWLRDLRREREIGDPDQTPLVPTAEEIERYRLMVAGLHAAVLKDRDLRAADLTDAFLPGADLRGADARGAVFQGADLRAAHLDCIDTPSSGNRGVAGGCTQMQEANLAGAQMQGADLRGADARGAVFQGADLRGTRLECIDSPSSENGEVAGGCTQMQGAVLHGAQMQGADLRLAQMQGGDLGRAQMQGAILRGAQMQGADLGWSQMQGADLGEAQMQDSDCRWADFRAALVHSADLACRDGTLRQEQLEFAVGNADTILPEPLYVWSCLDRAALAPEILSGIETALAHHVALAHRTKESDLPLRISRAEFEGLLFCVEGEVPRKVGRHPDPAE